MHVGSASLLARLTSDHSQLCEEALGILVPLLRSGGEKEKALVPGIAALPAAGLADAQGAKIRVKRGTPLVGTARTVCSRQADGCVS